jgi:hypothetical protein
MGELCRFNGCKGEYDGYGRCGGFDSDGGDPVAWHEKCYQESPFQDDETPSKHAPNQGFGPEHLPYMEGYNSEAETLFVVNIDGSNNAEKTEDWKRFSWFITPDGLQDQEEWEERSKNVEDEVEKVLPSPDWGNITEEEREEWYNKYDVEKDKILGPSPQAQAIRFASFAEAKEALHEAIKDMPDYYAYVYGKQGNVRGMVYAYERTKDYNWKEKDPEKREPGTYTEKVAYDWEKATVNASEDQIAEFHLLRFQKSLHAAEKQLALLEENTEIKFPEMREKLDRFQREAKQAAQRCEI